MSMDDARTWMDYQSPPEAFMNLIALHGCTLVLWKPAVVKIAAPGNRNLFGMPWWTIEEWIAQIGSLR
jgi:hypothetical protein